MGGVFTRANVGDGIDMRRLRHTGRQLPIESSGLIVQHSLVISEQNPASLPACPRLHPARPGPGNHP